MIIMKSRIAEFSLKLYISKLNHLYSLLIILRIKFAAISCHVTVKHHKLAFSPDQLNSLRFLLSNVISTNNHPKKSNLSFSQKSAL